MTWFYDILNWFTCRSLILALNLDVWYPPDIGDAGLHIRVRSKNLAGSLHNVAFLTIRGHVPITTLESHDRTRHLALTGKLFTNVTCLKSASYDSNPLLLEIAVKLENAEFAFTVIKARRNSTDNSVIHYINKYKVHCFVNLFSFGRYILQP